MSASRPSSPSAGGSSKSGLPTCSRGCRKAFGVSRSCCSSCSIICLRFPEHYTRTDGLIENRTRGEEFEIAAERAPLELAGRLVQGGPLPAAAGDAGYRLVAAVLCFPAHWRLSDKLGRPAGGDPRPGAGLGERLALTVDRFFESIQVARPVWRVNWSLVDTPTLFLPPEHRGHPKPISAERAGSELWLRAERQTLRRLPGSGDVVFGIHTHVDRLEDRRSVRLQRRVRSARASAKCRTTWRATRASYRSAGPCSPGSTVAPRLSRAPAGRDRPRP